MRAITTDFEAVEVQLIARALQEDTGASPQVHISCVMVRCAVHFDQDVNKRYRKAGSKGLELRQAIWILQNAESPCLADEIIKNTGN